MLALHGYNVAMGDIDGETAERARVRLVEQARDFAARGLFPEDAAELIEANLTAARTIEEAVEAADYIAEASAGSVVQLRVTEHRAGVLEWISRLSRQAGASDPDGLARTLALLLEGALAPGMPTLNPDNPRLAHAAARQNIQQAPSPAPIKAAAATWLR